MQRSFVRARARTVSSAAAALLVSSAAGADDGAVESKAPESHVAIEVRLAPYRPRIDPANDGSTPWRETFGTEKLVMLGGELDVQLAHVPHFGSLALGGLFGHTSASAEVITTTGTGKKKETASFDLWLLAALAVVRLDVVARETTVPLVPYAKVGAVTGLWSHSGSPRATKLAIGRGRSSGMLYAVGVMFLLDALDRRAARTLSLEQGMKHAYLFFEYTHVAIPGTARAVPVGDATWTLGLALEM